MSDLLSSELSDGANSNCSGGMHTHLLQSDEDAALYYSLHHHSSDSSNHAYHNCYSSSGDEEEQQAVCLERFLQSSSSSSAIVPSHHHHQMGMGSESSGLSFMDASMSGTNNQMLLSCNGGAQDFTSQLTGTQMSHMFTSSVDTDTSLCRDDNDDHIQRQPPIMGTLFYTPGDLDLSAISHPGSSFIQYMNVHPHHNTTLHQQQQHHPLSIDQEMANTNAAAAMSYGGVVPTPSDATNASVITPSSSSGELQQLLMPTSSTSCMIDETTNAHHHMMSTNCEHNQSMMCSLFSEQNNIFSDDAVPIMDEIVVDVVGTSSNSVLSSVMNESNEDESILLDSNCLMGGSLDALSNQDTFLTF